MSTVHTHPAFQARRNEKAADLKEQITKGKIKAIKAIGIAIAKLEAANGSPGDPLVTNMMTMLDRTVSMLEIPDVDLPEDAAILSRMRHLLEISWKLIELGDALDTVQACKASKSVQL